MKKLIPVFGGLKEDSFNFELINPRLPESIRIVNKVRNRMAFFQMEAKLQGDMKALAWGLELFKILFLLEPLLLFGALKQLDTKSTQYGICINPRH